MRCFFNVFMAHKPADKVKAKRVIPGTGSWAWMPSNALLCMSHTYIHIQLCMPSPEQDPVHGHQAGCSCPVARPDYRTTCILYISAMRGSVEHVELPLLPRNGKPKP
jgi:hypothetical protein